MKLLVFLFALQPGFFTVAKTTTGYLKWKNMYGPDYICCGEIQNNNSVKKIFESKTIRVDAGKKIVIDNLQNPKTTGRAIAQSPGLTINVIMDSVKADGTRYKIEMKICKPKKMTERGSWFSHDTSTIDFTSLKANEIDCGKYFDKGIGEPLTYNKEEIPFNKFEFSCQSFAWEEIYVFKISDWSSRGWHPEMYIVIPMKYKSFWTHIDITDVEFMEGKCVFLTDTNAFYDEKKLNIRQSLKNSKAVAVRGFPLEKLLEQK